MRSSVIWRWSIRFVLCAVPLGAGAASAQDSNPPPRQVMLTDPTPRPPDLQRQYSQDPAEVKKRQEALLLQNQLRAREIWLEANQILFLAQQLQDEMIKHSRGDSMALSAVKAGDIEKLAKSVKEKLKVHE